MGFRTSPLTSLAADAVTSGAFTGAYTLPGTLDVGSANPKLELGKHSDNSHGLRLYNAAGQVVVDLSADNGNAIFAGSLQAAGGTFAGNLQAAGGSFAGSLSAGVSISAPTIDGGNIIGAEVSIGQGSWPVVGLAEPALGQVPVLLVAVTGLSLYFNNSNTVSGTFNYGFNFSSTIFGIVNQTSGHIGMASVATALTSATVTINTGSGGNATGYVFFDLLVLGHN